MTAARKSVLVVGGGPAGLMAAEVLAMAGHAVTVAERMPSLGRKFLMAGRGGLNLTHTEHADRFLDRYGGAADWLEPMIRAFPPDEVIAWCEGLGQPVFTGSSGRVFPLAMKASPLLRAWLARLGQLGVAVLTRTEWLGFDEAGGARLGHGDGVRIFPADAVILACGGASWPKLGSDGAWSARLAALGVPIAPLQPSNAGVFIRWSDVFRDRHAGAPLKRIALTVGERMIRGEAVVTRRGLEGGVVYALGPEIRAGIAERGEAELLVDLRPDLRLGELADRLSRARPGASLSTALAKQAGLLPAAASLVREAGTPPTQPAALARRIKAVKLTVTGVASFDRAISTAGGVRRAALDDGLMLKDRPGVFAAGEMLDWDAPTGGYLLQASFATGRAAAEGAKRWLGR